MNLSQYAKRLLFASFLPYFETTSWPTYLSMSCEVVSKSDKKSNKNQTF
jgi:hypothetical protein